MSGIDVSGVLVHFNVVGLFSLLATVSVNEVYSFTATNQ